MANIRQKGAVSIFSVIFAALLLLVLTVSFTRLMISGQQRAINNDLSQSAYDAALAGVEDAKRVVRRCLSGSGSASSLACAALDQPDDCKVISRAQVAGSVADSEVVVRSASSGNDGSQFDQAYTCVNIAMNTPDYLSDVREGQAEVIPLRSVGEFNRVVVEWYSQADVGSGGLATRPSGGPSDLPRVSDWGPTAPPLMRAQLISPGASFSVEHLDSSAASQTVFMRPGNMVNGTTNFNVSMNRARATDGGEHSNQLVPLANCSRNFANNGYSCRATLELSNPISANDSNSAFLRLNSIYKNSQIRISLLSATGDIVNFRSVQPAVDSTGRANNLFRRTEARLEVGEQFSYPSYAVDVVNDLCKDFSVNDERADSGLCQP